MANIANAISFGNYFKSSLLAHGFNPQRKLKTQLVLDISWMSNIKVE